MALFTSARIRVPYLLDSEQVYFGYIAGCLK